MASEPRVKEVRATVSVGGKVQLVKFEQSADYYMSISRTYETDMTDEEASDFQAKLVKQLREEVEPHAAEEYDALMDAKKQLS